MFTGPVGPADSRAEVFFTGPELIFFLLAWGLGMSLISLFFDLINCYTLSDIKDTQSPRRPAGYIRLCLIGLEIDKKLGVLTVLRVLL